MSTLTFAHTRDAEHVLKAAGFSIGIQQRDAPRGLMFDDSVISKWRNLGAEAQAYMHGTLERITPGPDSPVEVKFRPHCPPEAIKAILSVLARCQQIEDQRPYWMLEHDRQAITMCLALPPNDRAEMLRLYSGTMGPLALADLFSEFIGMAKLVVSNAHEMISIERTCEGLETPDRPTTRLNLPTLMGAIMGMDLADGVGMDGVCSGCAFRVGTIANQSPITTADARHCADGGGEHFMCHEALDDDGNPNRACAGYARAQNQRGSR